MKESNTNGNNKTIIENKEQWQFDTAILVIRLSKQTIRNKISEQKTVAKRRSKNFRTSNINEKQYENRNEWRKKPRAECADTCYKPCAYIYYDKLPGKTDYKHADLATTL